MMAVFSNSQAIQTVLIQIRLLIGVSLAIYDLHLLFNHIILINFVLEIPFFELLGNLQESFWLFKRLTVRVKNLVVTNRYFCLFLHLKSLVYNTQ